MDRDLNVRMLLAILFIIAKCTMKKEWLANYVHLPHSMRCYAVIKNHVDKITFKGRGGVKIGYRTMDTP